MASDVNKAMRRYVADRAYHVCEYCLIHEDDTFWGCEVDHIISRKHGGTSDPANLAWACASCNSSKGSDLDTLVGHGSEPIRLFHPRSEKWAQCFQLHGVRVDPLSAVGEATVKLLRMNETNRLNERLTLAATGRYPTIEALARMTE